MALPKIKKSEKAAVSLVPAWHPNFRNFERLPDVKVVRTSFFVNCVAVVITLVVLLYFGLQEYKLRDVRLQINDWQHQIDANQKPSEQAVSLYRKFQEAEGKATEIAAFVKSNIIRSNFVVDLGQSLPDNIVLTAIEVRETDVVLRGLVRGTSEEASGKAEAYLDQLRGSPRLRTKFDAEMPSISRDTKANQLDFEIVLKSKNQGPYE
jgi:hypothetical protein